MTDKINVSRIQDIFRCEKYAHMKWREKKIPVFEAVPLQVGTAWHAAMEVLMTGGSAQAAINAADTILQQVDKSQLFEKKLAEFEDQCELLEAVMPHVVIPKEWEILQVEEELQVDLAPWSGGMLKEGDLILRGRPDAVVRWNGKLWHVQHKTAGRSTNWALYERGIQRSFHEAAYLVMIQQKFPKEDVAGTLLMGLKKISAASAAKEPQAALHRAFIPVRPASIMDAMITLAKKGVFTIATDSLHDQGIPIVSLENRDSCLGPFKNMPCPYLDVCEGKLRLNDPAFFKEYDPYAVYDAEPAADV